MPTRKRTLLVLAALPLLAFATALASGAPVMPASSATPAVYLPCLARHAGPPPTPTPTSTASPTVTITPTPTLTATASPTPTITSTRLPPFDGVVQLYPPSAMDGHSWPPYEVVVVQVTSPDGSAVDAVTVTTEADGHLPWTTFHQQVEEGDWVTVTLGDAAIGFPVVMVRAVADPATNTIIGTARAYARVSAGIEHPQGTWTHVTSVARPDGEFLLDSSLLVDWVYGDHLWVGQNLNANATVRVGDGSPYVTVIAPTPTPTNTPTATPSHDGPPYIHIATPEGPLFARRTYTLTVTVGDVDHNVASVTAEQQLGMGDRYTGTEYVTSQVLPLLVLDGENLVVRTDYPGNYRVWVRAVDTTGLTGEKGVELGVYWAPGENPFEIRGICDGGYTPDVLDEAIVVLDRMVQDGANWVQLNPHGYMENAESTQITILPSVWSPDVPGHTYSDEMLAQIIDSAHERGLRVAIKTMIQIGNWEAAAYDINPSNWDTWFDSYTEFVLHYARIAQEHQLELVFIGAEQSSSHSEVDNWRQLVADVRQVYLGKVSYNGLGQLGEFWDYPRFPAWDLMDIIGVSFYPACSGWLTPDPDNTYPSIEQMERNILRSLEGMPRDPNQRWGLDVVSGETGAASYYDGISIEPPSNTHPPDAVPDLQEVVDYFEARYRVIAQLPWFTGGMEWRMQMRNPAYTAPGSIFPGDIRDQPIEKAMRFWWTDLEGE